MEESEKNLIKSLEQDLPNDIEYLIEQLELWK